MLQLHEISSGTEELLFYTPKRFESSWKTLVSAWDFKQKKKTFTMSHNKLREAHSLHDATSHWLHGNYIPKFGCHYFWPGLIALPKHSTLLNLFCFTLLSCGYLFCFINFSCRCFTSSIYYYYFYYFCNEPIWLAHSKKKLKLQRLPKIQNYTQWWSASPFGPPI
jgi:hypothetical protein